MLGREQSHIQLTIRRKGEINAVELRTGGPLIQESEIRVDEALLQGLVAQVMHLAKPSSGPGEGEYKRGNIIKHESTTSVRRLQSIGEQIFAQLLPQPAREQLQTAAPTDLYLHVDEQLIHVPWELAYDGADFLATKFRLGRHVHIPRQIPRTRPERVETGLLKVLLIADPMASLPQAAQEAEQLCRLLDRTPKVKVTLIGGKLVSKAEVFTALQAHDVVHFAGHSHYDPAHPSRSGWHLHEGVLSAEELSNLSRPPLLVFSNSCQAGATWGRRYQYDGQAFGIGSAFLAAGVRNYIGTFWVVHDEESRYFAVAFYKGLTSGLSLGEALLQARLALRSQNGGERLTWASYMLYGDPTITPFPTVAQTSISLPPVNMERKLVAILSADVTGYSRLMGEDEVATVHTLTAYREVMATLIQQHSGEVVGTPGDNLLALFPSVVGAVQGAVEIQEELKRRNTTLPIHRKMEFRIGINLGDVILQGKDLYDVHGDAVNIAARLERLAKPGGICISGIVHEQVKNKLTLRYAALGEKNLKNIQYPVPVYRVLLAPVLSSLREKRRKKEVKTRAIVVRSFEVLKADPRHAWIKENEAIPHRLNSELSHVPGLKVYPREHFDWLLQQCKFSDIELAGALGIAKVIRGSFLVAGNICRIEAHLDDVENVTHEPSDEAHGTPEDFFQLIQELAMKITNRLNLKQTRGVTRDSCCSIDSKLRLFQAGSGETRPCCCASGAAPSR